MANRSGEVVGDADGSADPRPLVWMLDDDPNYIDTLRRVLASQREYWRLRFSTSPEEVLDEIHEHPEVVLVSDWQMGSMSGLELCSRIRAEADGRTRPYVILLTGRIERDSAAEALEAGADDYVPKPFVRRELIARINVGARIVSMQSALFRANRELKRHASTDALTQIPNRRQGLRVLGDELARANRGLAVLSLFVIDVDRFKQINDRYGHPAGDAVLVEVARRIAQASRSYDTPVRWGGEEFLLICPGLGPRDIETVYERVRSCLEDPIVLPDGVACSVTLSFGVVSADRWSPADPLGLVARADEALYRAKSDGRDCLRSMGLFRGESPEQTPPGPCSRRSAHDPLVSQLVTGDRPANDSGLTS